MCRNIIHVSQHLVCKFKEADDGQVIRAPDLKSAGHMFKSHSDQFNSLVTLVNNQLVCLLPVGILTIFVTMTNVCSFALFDDGQLIPGGDSYMKGAGMLDIPLRGVNFGFWSHLGCSERIVIIFSSVKVSFRVAIEEI